MKRTNVDFSKHIHTVEVYKSGDNEIQIDHFTEPGTIMFAIHFMNAPSGLIVYGDCGNWMFCRNFYPSGENGVSDGYWVEKLKIGSCQDPYSYDSEETVKEIEELIESGLEEYGYNGKRLVEAKEWFGELLQETDDELDYTHKAYRDYYKPSFIDYEQIPFSKKLNGGLKCVFDAFDIMCERMKLESGQTKE